MNRLGEQYFAARCALARADAEMADADQTNDADRWMAARDRQRSAALAVSRRYTTMKRVNAKVRGNESR